MNDQNTNQNPTVDLTALIEELGIKKLPREEQEKVLGDIIDAVNFRVLTRVSNTLDQDQREQLKGQIMQNPEKTQEIILELITKEQQAQIFQEEIEAVKNELKQES